MAEQKKPLKRKREEESVLSPLNDAIQRQNLTNLQKLLAGKADIKGAGALFCLAVTGGNPKIVQALLDAKANPNQMDNSMPPYRPVLHRAIRHQPIVELLLKYRAEPDLPDGLARTAMDEASIQGLSTIVDILLTARAVPRVNGFNGAAAMGHRGIVEKFLSNGMDINSSDILNDGNTALHRAAYSGQIAMVKLLLSKKADIKAINTKKQTILHAATTGSRNYQLNNNLYEMVHTLLHAGVDSRAVDHEGYTALQTGWKYECHRSEKTRQLIENYPARVKEIGVALLAGLHPRVGAGSTLARLGRNSLFDCHILKLPQKLAGASLPPEPKTTYSPGSRK